MGEDREQELEELKASASFEIASACTCSRQAT